MKNLIPLTLIALTLSCSTKEGSNKFNVQHEGALKNMMHKGDISAKANLLDFQDSEHLYALGAVENLKGEILILDGKAFISTAKDGHVVISNSFDHKATLLVHSQVDDWMSFEIPAKVSSHDDLQDHIDAVAKSIGIDVNGPFPFMIEGTPKSFDWHVIDWPEGDPEHSHDKHVTSGPHGTMTGKQVEILGFYSNSHHAVFTHHTTNMHMHVKAKDGSVCGHLDGLSLGERMTMKLPIPVDSELATGQE